ncbi:MAG: hypothetical protein JW750_12470, partial [Anaerolineaceae bacterium]|nr:hypothetical protein [Anaerolineaceae bacterium]
MNKKLYILLSVFILVAMVLGACGGGAKATEEAVTEEETTAGEELAVGIVLPTKDEPRWIQDEARFADALQAAG